MKKILALCTLFSVCALAAGDKPYRSGDLYGNEAFRYGRFEASMKMPSGNGLVSSMFTYYGDSYKGKPEPWSEIDIEVLGKNSSSFQSNIISGYAAPTEKVTSEKHHEIKPASEAAFHTYAIEWTPDYVAWFLDGVQVRKDTGAQVQWLKDGKDQRLEFNLWASTVVKWVEVFDPSILPVRQYIDWVKVYSYTPGTGPEGSDFTLNWEDPFDTFDDTRWSKANWSFDENYVDFKPDNIQVVDGQLVMTLEAFATEALSAPTPASWKPQAFFPHYDLLGRNAR